MEKRDDYEYEETPVKKVGKSKGRKGNVPPKVYTVPNLINEGSYNDTKPSTAKSGGKGGKGSGWKSSGVQAPASPAKAIYDTPPKKGGKSSISELPGQYTKVPKSGGR